MITIDVEVASPGELRILRLGESVMLAVGSHDEEAILRLLGRRTVVDAVRR